MIVAFFIERSSSGATVLVRQRLEFRRISSCPFSPPAPTPQHCDDWPISPECEETQASERVVMGSSLTARICGQALPMEPQPRLCARHSITFSMDTTAGPTTTAIFVGPNGKTVRTTANSG